MDKTLHKILMDLAWDMKDVGCKLSALQTGIETLSDEDRALLQEASAGIEHIVDLLGQK